MYRSESKPFWWAANRETKCPTCGCRFGAHALYCANCGDRVQTVNPNGSKAVGRVIALRNAGMGARFVTVPERVPLRYGRVNVSALFNGLLTSVDRPRCGARLSELAEIQTIGLSHRGVWCYARSTNCGARRPDMDICIAALVFGTRWRFSDMGALVDLYNRSRPLVAGPFGSRGL